MAGVVAAMSISRAGSTGSDGSYNPQRAYVHDDSVKKALRRVDTRQAAKPKTPTDPDAIRLAAAIKLQENFRRRCLYPQRLHRDNLSQRLLFEWRVFYGAIRLINQIMVFALLLIALRQSGDSGTKRGIFHNLKNHFEFDELSETTRRADLRDTLVDLSTRSKDFFVLSSQYFEPSATGGSVELIGAMETFSAAKVIGGVQLSIQVPEFSFTCWVRTVRQFKRGYIIRKRIVPAGSGTELACWGWHLTDIAGPFLHYGAHDFYGTDAISGSTQKQHIVGLPQPSAIAPEEYFLLSVVVQGSTVTFWRNLENLGSAELPRAITDCFNNLEGVLVGDAGLTLAQLRFYPRAMTRSSIQEIYEGGSFLSDISTGSMPTKPAESELAVMGRAMMTAFVNVEQSVADQQPRSEIDLVLQSVDVALSQQVPAQPSAVAPLGETLIDPTVRNDPLTGRDYTLLFEGPAKLGKPSLGNERFFDGQTFPDWSGQGVTFTMWYRHPPCSISSCGVYLLSAHHEGPQSSSRCWSIWIEDIAVYFDNQGSETGYHYALDFMDPKFHVSNRHWRHIAYVFDETTDNWLFYQDGNLAYSVPFGSSVKAAHCPTAELKVSFGARFPGWSYGLEYELFDMRAYVGLPLTGDNIQALAFARTDALGMLAFPQNSGETQQEWADRVDSLRHRYRCTALNSEVMKDNPWQDLYGHGCQWFHDNKADFPGVCELPEARIQCPIACKSLQECYSNFEVPEPFFAWDSIRRIEARGSNGTLCLGSKREAQKIVQECRDWRNSEMWREGIETWERDMAQREGRRVNMTDCDELERSIDNACAFEEAKVEAFTREVLKNGGDYTVAFWIRALNEDSLYENGRFYPHVQFVNTFSPPRHNLGWAHYGDGKNGAARVNTACPGDGAVVEGLEIERVSESEWSFLSFSRVNTTWNTPEGSQGETATNLKHWQETSGAFKQCLFDESSFFTGIEVNYPALISPVMLVPAKLPFAKVQEVYYEKWGSMRVRDGPLMTNAERETTTIPVDKKDYSSRSVLMAAPIIFTTRRQPNSTCPFEYGTQWLQEQHEAVQKTQCALPFECQDEVWSKASSTMACSGESHNSEPFFGLEPVDFRGWGFADILFSITDSPFVYRGGELQDTEAFVDSQTQTVDVILVFFTPQYGITTVMEVQMDLSGPKDVVLDVTIRHYSILEGSELTSYIVVQCLVLFCILFMVLDVIYEARQLWMHRDYPNINVKMEIVKHVTDVITAISVTVFVVLRLPQIMSTSGETKRILGGLTGIPWSDPEISMEQKKDSFFRSIEDLLSRISEVESLDSFLNVILIISLLRIIQCTSLHPRLALLTGTVGKAMDDFWHAAMLILLMMTSFALIGTWRFGDSMEEFGTFERSMQTEFELMFGEFIDGWHEDLDLQAFVVLYYMVMFMLVLNFLLAIIVEAYMGVRKEVEALEVEQEFLTDLFDTFRAIITARIMGWPSTKDLGTILGGAKAKLSVGFSDLHHMNLFDDQQKVGSFLKFYSRFEFLDPPEISKSGKVVNQHKEEPMEERIVRMVCEALDIKPKRLKDIARTHRPHSGDPSPVAPRSPARKSSLKLEGCLEQWGRPAVTAAQAAGASPIIAASHQQPTLVPDAGEVGRRSPSARLHEAARLLVPLADSPSVKWTCAADLEVVREESAPSSRLASAEAHCGAPSAQGHGRDNRHAGNGENGGTSVEESATISQGGAALVSPDVAAEDQRSEAEAPAPCSADTEHGEATAFALAPSPGPDRAAPATPPDAPTTPTDFSTGVEGTPPQIVDGTPPLEGTPPADEEDASEQTYMPVAHISPSSTAGGLFFEL